MWRISGHDRRSCRLQLTVSPLEERVLSAIFSGVVYVVRSDQGGDVTPVVIFGDSVLYDGFQGSSRPYHTPGAAQDMIAKTFPGNDTRPPTIVQMACLPSATDALFQRLGNEGFASAGLHLI
jgi:hypothetical protein